MKCGLLFIISLFSLQASFAQKLTYFKSTRVKIINFVVDKDPNKLPLLSFTILNNSKKNIILNKIVLSLKEFKKHPLSTSSNDNLESKVLTPMAGLDLNIPTDVSNYQYLLKSPIEIASNDAATIQIRIHCDFESKCVVPAQIGFFRFSLFFVNYDLKMLRSGEITFGN
jgi:hypothetical protein